MNWSTIWPIVQLILSAVSPELKSLALAELQKLAAAEAGNVFLQALVTELETLVAAA